MRSFKHKKDLILLFADKEIDWLYNAGVREACKTVLLDLGQVRNVLFVIKCESVYFDNEVALFL